VVVPDATAAAYPEEGSARRALYVAVTRTRHQLVVASVGERTRLLPRG
jgi:ATP-dependent exoDNAse (exonuclease V) beta subunit